MKQNSKRITLAAVLFIAFALIGFGIGYFLIPPKEEEPSLPPETASQITAEEEETVTKISVETTETKEEKEPMSKTPLMKGIDVSKWQGKPDWKKIAADGVEFAMIRIGFHGTSGPLGEDSSADYNLKSADENGILTGVYFYSLAKDTADAEEEAAWVLERIGNYAISLPVVIDYEMMDNDASATAAERTDIALAFLHKIRDAGYEGMLYVPIKELNNASLWEKERILSEFKVWGADYDISVTEENRHPDGVTDYAMWQYSNTGRVAGISGNVDLNFAYFKALRSDARS